MPSSPFHWRAVIAVAVPVIAVTLAVAAADWAEVVLDAGILPLENRVTGLGPAENSPDLLVFTLWNTGTNQNRLGAFLVPPPYDGSGVTFTQNIDVGPLYGIGNICVPAENRAVIPYIKWVGGNYDVYFAEFNGASWSTAAVPGTSTDEYHTSDCFVTPDGVFLMVLNATDLQWEFYQRPLGGGAWQLADVLDNGTLSGFPQDPWNGGGIATASSGWQGYMPTPVPGSTEGGKGILVGGAFPVTDVPGNPGVGRGLIGLFHPLDISGTFTPQQIVNFVFESRVRVPPVATPPPAPTPAPTALPYAAYHASQNNGNLQVTGFNPLEPDMTMTVDLGPIQPGTVIPNFQGVSVATLPNGDILVTADRALRVSPDLSHVVELFDWPGAGAGGPSDANWHVFLPAHIEAVTLNPGSQILAILSAPLFEDSFESGDTSGWSGTNP